MRPPFRYTASLDATSPDAGWIHDADGRPLAIAHGGNEPTRDAVGAALVALLNAGAAATVQPAPAEASWAIVEIMGHRRLAGRITEQLVAGRPLLRIDCPGEKDGDWVTQMYGAQSIFSVTPCTEEVARRAAKQWLSTPVRLLAPGAGDDQPITEVDFDEVGDW